MSDPATSTLQPVPKKSTKIADVLAQMGVSSPVSPPDHLPPFSKPGRCWKTECGKGPHCLNEKCLYNHPPGRRPPPCKAGPECRDECPSPKPPRSAPMPLAKTIPTGTEPRSPVPPCSEARGPCFVVLFRNLPWEMRKLVFVHLKARGWNPRLLLDEASKTFWTTALSVRMRKLCHNFRTVRGNLDFSFGCAEQKTDLMTDLDTLQIGKPYAALFRALIVLRDLLGFSEVLEKFFQYEWSDLFPKEEFGNKLKDWYVTNSFDISTSGLNPETRRWRKMVRAVKGDRWNHKVQLRGIEELYQELLANQARGYAGGWRCVERFKGRWSAIVASAAAADVGVEPAPASAQVLCCLDEAWVDVSTQTFSTAAARDLCDRGLDEEIVEN